MSERWPRPACAQFKSCRVVVLALGMAAGTAVRAEDLPGRIAGAAMTSSGASAFLERLTDEVGARVTGSKELRAASELILAELKRAGYATARFEDYPLESRWTRGPATGQIISPIHRTIQVGSYAWVPGTQGEIAADLVDAGAPASSALPLPLERFRGAAVIVEPQKLGADPSFVMRAGLARALAEAGAAAMLIPSDKPGRMLYTSAFGFFPKGPLPVISVAKEDARLLRRLLAKGPVRVSLDVKNAFDTSPHLERNVIADLPGREAAEIVLLGAHYDSWDFAQGADDDGSGVAALLEAARILRSLDVRPRRTIRFAFFSGEEQGCLGSRAYVVAHEAELDAHKAVLVMDSGAGSPRGVELHGRTDLEKPVKGLLGRLASLGAASTTIEASFDRDHAPFMVVGVPAMTLWVEEGDYDSRHHTATDTFDNVDPRRLALDTAVMAVLAWQFSDSTEPLGRRLDGREAAELLKQSGVEGTKRMVYGSSAR